MNKQSFRIAIFVLVMIFLPLDGGMLTSFITEVLTTGVLEWFKTLLNKHLAYYF